LRRNVGRINLAALAAEACGVRHRRPRHILEHLAHPALGPEAEVRGLAS
jgi:hypothetical protein